MLGWGDPAKARPFTSLDAMTEGLLENLNEVVQPGDVVYHLGDMFWRNCNPEAAQHYINHANGCHYYIRGNHEEFFDKHREIRDKFAWVKDRYILHHQNLGPMDGKRSLGIVLDHYAGWVWDGSHSGSWQLYGHSHGGLDNHPARRGLLAVDVGVDSWGMYPVSLEQIVDVMAVKRGERDGVQV
jgi:calcineurin-like phosphoesterase family protein